MPSRTSHVRFRPRPSFSSTIDDAQALLVVVEAAGHQRVDDALAGVPERRVAEIVAERDRFGQLLVQPQHLGDGPRDLRHLERVRQPRAVVVAGRREEHLRLVLEPPERLAVDDAIAIALKRRPDVVFALGAQAAARVGALGRLRREDLALARLELFAEASHGQRSRSAESSCRGRARRRRSFAPASGRGPRTSAACRGRRPGPARRGARRRAAARTRASGRCSASSDRCRDRR